MDGMLSQDEINALLSGMDLSGDLGGDSFADIAEPEPTPEPTPAPTQSAATIGGPLILCGATRSRACPVRADAFFVD